MPPIRRYLRISKYTVLECRIYLENPSDTRWLVDPRDRILPRIFAAIRPLVLPKLREENERLFSRKKGKPVKDVIAEDDFEVALFLRESRTRHSLLTRHKEFDGPDAASDSRRAGTVDGHGGAAESGIMVESDDEELDLNAIPRATEQVAEEEEEDVHGKRQRGSESEEPPRLRASKRKKNEEEPTEDKKMRFQTNYEGFNIYGWTLCLLVTRKGDRVSARPTQSESSRQVLMEEWISTQAQADLDEE
ncbi:hypothetical protein P168DRAFT_239131 [Aspergillus campestris IBT 28561]|uniref:Uncharacterized protein n=1 Tax=Aspergillus campestris (strain IBT 28561) TaxID=1392248 RepID=A0A2I1CYM0_ASPC2|nr:uncharacterized protein P168DRAFT_239131 [Aspergillus campestris IBT 28561]PKY02720.1 hypothetical protein P168DRAFT_239131 [Aspergillus campestris IBT 28561]